MPKTAKGEVIQLDTPVFPNDDFEDLMKKMTTGQDAYDDIDSPWSMIFRGMRGTGKSSVFLDWENYTVQRIYEDIYGTLDRTDESGMKECAEKTLMCVMDFDYEGYEKLIQRKDALDPWTLPRVKKIGMTGGISSPDDNVDQKINKLKYTEAVRTRDLFLKMLKQHSGKHPEFRSARFFVIENLEELYQSTVERYFVVVTDGAFEDIGDAFLDARKRQHITKKFEPWMVGGNNPRDVYGAINSIYRSFWRKIFGEKTSIGFNMIATTHVAHFKDKDSGRMSEYTLGKIDKIDQYFDVVATTMKIKKDEDWQYWIGVKGEHNKSRGSEFVIQLPKKGQAKVFFDKLYEDIDNKKTETEESESDERARWDDEEE